MVVRETFQSELENLKNELMDMGNMANQALSEAIVSLKDKDLDKAQHIIDNDYKINELEEDINNKAIAMIAKQQPVASDLRRIIVALKISSDLERIGDISVNMAKSIKRIGDEPHIKPLVDIPKMAAITQEMTTKALKAFYEEDVAAAKEVAEIDDEVDETYGKVIQELLTIMSEQPENMPQITQLSFICRFIERVGDHITNICESIIYLVKGKRYDLD